MVGQFGEVRVVDNCFCVPSVEVNTGGGWTPFRSSASPGARLTDPTPGGGFSGPWTDRAEVIRANLRPVTEGGVLRRVWWQKKEWDAWLASQAL